MIRNRIPNLADGAKTHVGDIVASPPASQMLLFLTVNEAVALSVHGTIAVIVMITIA